jgi:hypothetical protein
MTSKIPPAEWDAIATRRDNGESVAYIARTYETSPATIYGILKKVAEAKGAAPEAPEASAPEPSAPPPPSAPVQPAPVQAAPAQAAPPAKAPEPAASASEATPRPMPSRLTLNAPARPPVAQPPVAQTTPSTAAPAAERPAAAAEPSAPQPVPAAAPAQPAAPFRFTYENRAVEPPPRQPRPPTTPRPFAQPEPKTALNANLDAELRGQADAAIATFQAAFEAVLGEETSDTRKALRQAASDLMRVAARTTIALERKDAAVDRAAMPAQRYRNEPLPDQQGDFRQGRRPPRN